MEFLEKVVCGFYPLTISVKSTILDVWLGCKYASELCVDNNICVRKQTIILILCNPAVQIHDKKVEARPWFRCLFWVFLKRLWQSFQKHCNMCFYRKWFIIQSTSFNKPDKKPFIVEWLVAGFHFWWICLTLTCSGDSLKVSSQKLIRQFRLTKVTFKNVSNFFWN